MNSHTWWRQFREVLSRIRLYSKSGRDLKNSRILAVEDVADEEGVTYQTILDGCLRRMDWKVAKFHEALVAWLKGNSKPLRDRAMDRCQPELVRDIRLFFEEPDRGTIDKSEEPSTPVPDVVGMKTMLIEVPEDAAAGLAYIAHRQRRSEKAVVVDAIGFYVASQLRKEADKLRGRDDFNSKLGDFFSSWRGRNREDAPLGGGMDHDIPEPPKDKSAPDNKGPNKGEVGGESEKGAPAGS